MQDSDGDTSPTPTACQETRRNRTFLVPRTRKASALTAPHPPYKVAHTLRYVQTFAFKFLCSLSASHSFESHSFRFILLLFSFAWHCPPPVPFLLMGNTFIMLSIAMLISAGVTLVRAESHTIRFKNQ